MNVRHNIVRVRLRHRHKFPSFTLRSTSTTRVGKELMNCKLGTFEPNGYRMGTARIDRRQIGWLSLTPRRKKKRRQRRLSPVAKLIHISNGCLRSFGVCVCVVCVCTAQYPTYFIARNSIVYLNLFDDKGATAHHTRRRQYSDAPRTFYYQFINTFDKCHENSAIQWWHE